MARSYSRDSRGRFSSGGGGGGGKKGGGGGAKSSGGGGKKATPKGAAGLQAAREAGRAQGMAIRAKQDARNRALDAQAARMGGGTGRAGKSKAAPAAAKPAASKPTAAAPNTKPAAAKPAKMGKAAPNAAKAAYKAATSQVRELKMYRGGKTDQTVKNAQAKVKRLEKSRGTTGTRRSKR